MNPVCPRCVPIGLLGGLGLVVVVSLFGCDSKSSTDPGSSDPRTEFGLETLGEIPYPPDNPPRQERIALGRMLFFDPILSGEKDVACGTCHHPDFAFADRRQFGAGTSGVGLGPARTVSASSITQNPISLAPRNTPTCFNTAFNLDESGEPSHEGLQFWDGRANSLETQSTKPITSRVEMRGDAYPGTDAEASAAALDSVLARLQEVPEYEALFTAAFPAVAARGTSAIDSSTYVRAIAAYERELVTRHSAYDRYVLGEDNALTPIQFEGLGLFFGKAKCSTCHDGPMFTNFDFVVIGVPQEGDGKDVIPGDDTGREEHTLNPADRYAFRVPSLRNVELTPPYMHDGVFNTLEEVVHFHNDGAQPRHPAVTDQMLDPEMVGSMGLTDREMRAVVEFMRALTDPGIALDPFLLTVPDRVPSGLTPVFGMSVP